MAEDPTPSAAAPLAGNATTTPALAATPEPLAGDGAETPISLEEAKKLRSESANMRKRLKAYEDAEKAAQDAALSQVEKANKAAQELQQKYEAEHRAHVAALVKLAASAKGIIDPDLAALAIEASLEFDEQGMPSNLDKTLDDLVKSKPYLAAKPAEQPASPAQTARPPAVPAMNPGRTSIQPSAPQGTFAPTRLTDVFKHP
jgi:hypothetical protein